MIFPKQKNSILVTMINMILSPNNKKLLIIIIKIIDNKIIIVVYQKI
jgi:hypothetical protein